MLGPHLEAKSQDQRPEALLNMLRILEWDTNFGIIFNFGLNQLNKLCFSRDVVRVPALAHKSRLSSCTELSFLRGEYNRLVMGPR